VWAGLSLTLVVVELHCTGCHLQRILLTLLPSAYHQWLLLFVATSSLFCCSSSRQLQLQTSTKVTT
jgi:hypothetical protein